MELRENNFHPETFAEIMRGQLENNWFNMYFKVWVVLSARYPYFVILINLTFSCFFSIAWCRLNWNYECQLENQILPATSNHHFLFIFYSFVLIIVIFLSFLFLSLCLFFLLFMSYFPPWGVSLTPYLGLKIILPLYLAFF